VSVETVTTQRVVAVDGVIVRRLATVGTQGPPGAGGTERRHGRPTTS
jgi:hypothetical protein